MGFFTKNMEIMFKKLYNRKYHVTQMEREDSL